MNDAVRFIIVQGIGLLAWLVLILSYYRKTENKIIICQVLATILYCIHYYLLGAYSGLIICMFEVVRDYGYYKTDWDKYIFIASIPVYIIDGVVNFTAWFDLLPIIASFTDGFSLILKKKLIVVWSIITYTLWVIYDLFVGSYSCAITDGVVAISNIFNLIFNKSLNETKWEKFKNFIKKLK